MISSNPLIQVHCVVENFLLAILVSHHGFALLSVGKTILHIMHNRKKNHHSIGGIL